MPYHELEHEKDEVTAEESFDTKTLAFTLHEYYFYGVFVLCHIQNLVTFTISISNTNTI